jgi:hypothetical protein
MRKVPTPKWIAEKFNRDTNQGDKPSCKSCAKKIAIGTLCIRTDYAYIFKNKNFKSDEFTLQMSAFRLCMKIKCFKDFNQKVVQTKKYTDESNIVAIDSIDLENVFDGDKVTVRNMF